MEKKEILSNLYQIQENMNNGIFEQQIFSDENIDKDINKEMQDALYKAIECVEFMYNGYLKLKNER